MNKIYQRDTESAAEFIIPDYMGDIKKILTVSARAIPSGRFINDSGAEFSGIVNYDVTYSDSEGNLTALSFSSDYDLSLKIDDEACEDVFGDFRVNSFSVRPTGPRKLVAKSNIGVTVCQKLTDTLSSAGDVFEGEYEPELAQKLVRCEKILYSNSAEREFAEDGEFLKGIDSDDVEIITTSGAVRIIESVPTGEGVFVRGEIIVTAILKTDEQPPFAIRRAIPFEEMISLEGVSEGMQTVADGVLTSVSCAVRPEEDGSTVTVSAIAEFSCAAASNAELSVTTDAYLKNRDVEALYEDFHYNELVRLAVSEADFTVEIGREELGLLDVRDIITMTADIRAPQKEISRAGIVLKGEAAFGGIACEIKENSAIAFMPVKFTAPFSLNIDPACPVSADERLGIRLSVVSVEPILDANKLTAEVKLKVFTHITKDLTVKRLVACNVFGEKEYENDPTVVTVYYPEAEESLFSIAKKFHTTPERIANENDLSISVFGGDCSEPLPAFKRIIIR